MTEEQMKLYLENQKVICEQSEKACRAIQKQTAEQSAEYTDHYIDGVNTIRKSSVVKSLTR